MPPILPGPLDELLEDYRKQEEDYEDRNERGRICTLGGLCALKII